MISLLQESNRRKVNILHQSIVSFGKLSTSHLRAINNCSLRTVYLDLEELNKIWISDLNFQVNQGIVNSEIMNASISEEVIKEIIAEDDNIQIFFYLYENDYVSLDDLTYYFNVSPTKIYSSFKIINGALKSIDVKVDKNNYGYFLNSENEIKIALFHAYLGHYLNFKPIHDQAYKYLKNVKMTKEYKNIIKIIPYPDIILELDNTLLSILIRIINFTPEENYTKAMNIYFDKIYSSQIICKEQLNEFYNVLTSRFVHNSLEIKEKDIPNILFLFQYAVIKSLIRQHIPLINEYRIDYFIYDFKKENDYFYNRIKDQIDKLYSNSIKNIEDLCNFFIYNIYTRLEPITFYRRNKILVLSDLSKNHALTIRNALIKHFPMHTFFAFKKNDFESINALIKKYQIEYIVSNYYINHDLSIPIVYFSDFPDNHDMFKFYKLIYHNTSESYKKKITLP